MAASQIDRLIAWARRHRQPDSAVADEYAAAYIGHNVPSSVPGGEVRTSWLSIENCGTKTWVQGDAQLSVNLDGSPVLCSSSRIQ